MKLSVKIKMLVIPLIPALFFAGFASNRIISSWEMLIFSYFPCLFTYIFGVFTGEMHIKEKYKYLFDQVK
ncbi:MAG: hypothetical protein ABFD82_21160 [Syntrophaceae bacterium]